MKGETGSPVMEMKKATASFHEETEGGPEKNSRATIVGARETLWRGVIQPTAGLRASNGGF